MLRISGNGNTRISKRALLRLENALSKRCFLFHFITFIILFVSVLLKLFLLAANSCKDVLVTCWIVSSCYSVTKVFVARHDSNILQTFIDVHQTISETAFTRCRHILRTVKTMTVTKFELAFTRYRHNWKTIENLTVTKHGAASPRLSC